MPSPRRDACGRSRPIRPGSLPRFGRFIGHVGPNHLWSFECDAEWPLQPEIIGAASLRGRPRAACGHCRRGRSIDLVVSVRDELGDSIASATLLAQPLFIYGSALRKRLNDDTGGCSMPTWLPNCSTSSIWRTREDVDPTRPDPQPQSNTAEPDDEPAEDEDNSVWGLSAEQLATARACDP